MGLVKKRQFAHVEITTLTNVLQTIVPADANKYRTVDFLNFDITDLPTAITKIEFLLSDTGGANYRRVGLSPQISTTEKEAFNMTGPIGQSSGEAGHVARAVETVANDTQATIAIKELPIPPGAILAVKTVIATLTMDVDFVVGGREEAV